MQRDVWLTLAALSLLIVGACSPIVNNRGNAPDPERVAELRPGTHTRVDVAAILGTPSILGTFDDRTWYYVSKQTERTAFFKPSTTDQQVLVVQFDDKGVVESIEKLGLQQARDVSPVSRETPTAGRELGLLEQLLGNVGRFSNAGGGGSKPRTGGPAR